MSGHSLDPEHFGQDDGNEEGEDAEDGAHYRAEHEQAEIDNKFPTLQNHLRSLKSPEAG